MFTQSRVYPNLFYFFTISFDDWQKNLQWRLGSSKRKGQNYYYYSNQKCLSCREKTYDARIKHAGASDLGVAFIGDTGKANGFGLVGVCEEAETQVTACRLNGSKYKSSIGSL